LIDVAEHGDYGFRFEYGRAGVHPLQAWNGELPGTMPMICGTGEAPTAVVFHRGYLWVTSWGDHRIERYQLTPNETGSYTAQMEVVVQGDADFRPTGMAVAPDGSLFFADWVDRSYPVHGKGRLWRLQLPKDMQCDLAPHQESPEVAEDSELTRLERLRWERTVAGEELIDLLREALQSPDDDVRLFAVRWIAEVRVLELADDLDKLLDAPPPSERYYLAVLGAIDWLNREPEQRHSGIADGLLARELRNSERSAESQALALRLMSPDYEFLTLERLRGYLQSDYKPLRLEAIRTLALREDGQRFALLADVLQNESQSDAVRAEALVGLAAAPTQYGPLIEQFAKGDNPVLRREAERTIRFVGPSPETEEKPSAGDLTAWVDLLAEPGDAASGRRLFFSPVGPRCAACHRYGGRGGLIGPDLSQIAQQSSRARTIASILDPSAEIAPHYQAWLLQTDDGKTHVGLRLPTGGDDGQEPYADPTGRTFVLPSETIELRQPSAASIMPAGLEKSLTIAELRDLVTFLMQTP
jgi:putative heme-binding domain-containing protein